MKPEWSGRLWLGRDYGLILGELGRTAPHAHYAHQLMQSLDGPITVSLDGHLLSTADVSLAAVHQLPRRSLDDPRLERALDQQLATLECCSS